MFVIQKFKEKFDFNKTVATIKKKLGEIWESDDLKDKNLAEFFDIEY